MNITNELVNEIRNKTDIVEIISEFVSLTPKGKNYFGVCPFHDDHSPSMSVSKEKQIYTCFSCGATGNVFNFIANYEHIGFYDAVRILGNRLGYNLGEKKVSQNKNAIDYEIYSSACKFYQNNLNTTQGKNAHEYLEGRHIDKETIKKFKIGLSTQNAKLTDYLISKGYDLKKLVDLGLSNSQGNDIFINRIMFPLFDLEGNIVAFSGRIYNTKDDSKYINTKETSIFKKGTILYNYHLAKEPLKKNDTIIVMEGFMDVIRSNTVGITNCIAVMGTALTKQNANLLKKMANNIILCFDGDSAGEKATVNAIEIFKEIDVTPKVIRLEEDLDPDEYILKYGYEKFKYKIDNPKSSIEFLMDEHRNNKNLSDIVDITKYINESLNDLLSVKDTVLIDLTLNKLSKEYKIEYNTLKNKYLELLNKQKKKDNLIVINEKKTNNKYNQYDLASRNLAYYMTKDDKIFSKVENKVTFIPNNIIRNLVNEMIYYYHKYGIFKVADFLSYINDKEEEYRTFTEIMNMHNKDDYSNEEIDDYISVINSYPIKNKVNELNKKLRDETDPLKQANILSEILSLKGVK